MSAAIFAAAVLSTATICGTALADVAPAEQGPCDSKTAGDACTTATGNAAGVCTTTTCSKLDYSHGSPPVGTIDYSCVLCVASTSQPSAGEGGVGGGTVDTGATGGCSMAHDGGLGAVAAWACAGAFSLLFAGRRRRLT